MIGIAAEVLDQLNVVANEGDLVAISPIDGSEIGRVCTTSPADVAAAVAAAQAAFIHWRAVPAPRRGELVRLLPPAKGEAARPATDAVRLFAPCVRDADRESLPAGDRADLGSSLREHPN